MADSSSWMRPGTPEGRSCDDLVVHCATQRQAERLPGAIAERLAARDPGGAACGLTVDREETKDRVLPG